MRARLSIVVALLLGALASGVLLGPWELSTRVQAQAGAFPIRVGSATLSNLAQSASNGTLLSSNSARIGVLLYNDTTAGAIELKYGATASSTSYTVQIAPGQYWEMPQPIYTGQIDVIWTAAGSGAARVTELAY